MSETNRALAIELVDAMVANDQETMRRLLDPEVELRFPPSSHEFLGVEMPIKGVEAVLEIEALGKERYEYYRYTPEIVVADGDGVAMFVRSDARLSNGPEFSNRSAYFLSIKDGRVTRLWEQPDTALLFSVFAQVGEGDSST
jgi:ketosteroid isomerase-like protein